MIEVAAVVYPFEALLAQKRGKVEVDFIIDQQGRLVSASIVKSDAPEFSAAVLAYADAMDFSQLVKATKAVAKDPNQALLALHQTIEFDERSRSKVTTAISTPPPAALEILKSLRRDPSGKEFGNASNLDNPLQVVRHSSPVFPRTLQEKLREGSATVEFYIAKDGQVLLPRAVSASDPAFGYSACQSVAGWKFTLPSRNGKPTVVRARIPINYSLNTTPSH